MQTKKILAHIIFLGLLFSQKSTQSQSIETKKDHRPKKAKIKWATSAWAISEELFNYVREIIPEGETILELGSGWGSEQF